MDPLPAPAAARHQRASEIFLSSVHLPLLRRREVLGEACSGDAALRAEVDSLLEQADETGGFLERPVDRSALERMPERSDPLRGAMPESVAGFRILRVLGWGSMGVVYLARQESPQRDIALKVLRAEAMSPQMRKRFAREAEVLAALRHPSIAQIHSVGFEQDAVGGRPWFALEYVRGRPLLEYAEAERLSVRARLELFVQICDGVHAAHEQGVVHRDLKPANLLVEQGGRPRILDFGVAHTTDADHNQTLLTVTGQLIGTLSYMSPEQAAGTGLRVDRRADVYSLGVLLFELLTGELPQATRGLDIPEAVRVIREEEPIALRTLRRELDLDLETIAATALAKERERRYSGADELAGDVRRWLRDEPIRARPASLVYQLTKLARRNRGLVIGTATTIAALAVGLVLSLLALDRARIAEAATGGERDATGRLADLRGLQVLQSQDRLLWPAAPELEARMQAWVDEAALIVRRGAQHRAHLTGLLARGNAPARELEMARQLVSDLERFTAPETGTYPRMRTRLACARELEQRTVVWEAGAWSAAVDGIARHPLYSGLRIEPQLGLLPLGPDPDTGLWEFAAYGASGTVPTRSSRSGRLDFTLDSAVVLVLLPGGSFAMGCQPYSMYLPNYDPDGQPHEGPVRAVALDPFFLSKYELTQGQYLRVMGDNPSLWEIGDRPHDVVHSQLFPVEFLDWRMACEVALRLGLVLPTEAQWEFAARAGTGTVYWSGNLVQDLECIENLYETQLVSGDARRLGVGLASVVQGDPFIGASPVGAFLPNPFGLYDMLGNVQEWCADPFKVRYHDLPLDPGDGLVQASSPDRDRSVRGSSNIDGGRSARCGARMESREEHRGTGVGLRLARPLHGAARPR